jgi:hypothetical protein
MDEARPRSLFERREAAVAHLRSNSNLWLATASDGLGPHLIPVSYWWDASRNDPRSVPGFTYIQLAPKRMQVWKGDGEFAGRTVMHHGVWLDHPID